MRDFITHTEAMQNRTDAALNRLERDIDKLSEEMDKSRIEMDKSRVESDKFRIEMDEFKEEMRADRREMNKQWGALANKMGTLDEDLVSPAVRPVLSKYFNCDPIAKTIRYLKRMDGESFEVDVLAVCEDKVFMIEVRSSPRTEHVDEVLEKASRFMKFFPEYKDKELIPIFASVTFHEDVVKHASRRGLYVMAYREWEYMDIINFDECKKC